MAEVLYWYNCHFTKDYCSTIAPKWLEVDNVCIFVEHTLDIQTRFLESMEQ